MNSCLTDYIARRNDTAPAVDDGRCAINYGELNDRSGRIAAHIREQYGSAGYVLVKTDSSVDYLTTLLGVMYSGNTPIPVAPSLPPPVIGRIARRAEARAIIDPVAGEIWKTYEPLFMTDPARPCLVMFTSGTSGEPKGVIMSHANLIHACRTVAAYLDYARFPSAAVVLPLHYSYGLLSQVLSQFFVGGFVRLFADLRNPINVAKAIAESGIETFCGVPSTFITLAKIHGMRSICMPSMRVVCSAGAAMNYSIIADIKAIFPHATVFNNYGMTEAAPRIAYIRDDDDRFTAGTCGRPIDGVAVKVVDAKTFEPVPDGVHGMLVVTGPNITAGYLNDAERTSAAFTPDGFLLTGDIAYLDKGYIFITGRSDEMFNVGGEKVSPLEIESELNAIPEVEVAAVRGFEDDVRGNIPVAFLILKKPIPRAQIVSRLEANLAPWCMPMTYYEVSDLPRTLNGKIRRAELRTDSPSVIGELR